MSNPVFQIEDEKFLKDMIGNGYEEESLQLGKWYFWTETWSDFVGPFEDEEACRYALSDYALHLDSGLIPPPRYDAAYWKFRESLK